MIGMIPVIVAGGIVKKFSESFLGKPTRSKQKRTKTKRTIYPSSKNKPF